MIYDLALISHFENRLLHERSRTLSRLRRGAPERGPSGAETVADEVKYSQHLADMGLQVQGEQTGFLLATHGGQQLAEIDDALRLLHADPARFFACDACGSGIEQPRLEFLPWTRRCARCARMAESN